MVSQFFSDAGDSISSGLQWVGNKAEGAWDSAFGEDEQDKKIQEHYTKQLDMYKQNFDGQEPSEEAMANMMDKAKQANYEEGYWNSLKGMVGMDVDPVGWDNFTSMDEEQRKKFAESNPEEFSTLKKEEERRNKIVAGVAATVGGLAAALDQPNNSRAISVSSNAPSGGRLGTGYAPSFLSNPVK